jgi:hypothetical protein
VQTDDLGYSTRWGVVCQIRHRLSLYFKIMHNLLHGIQEKSIRKELGEGVG